MNRYSWMLLGWSLFGWLLLAFLFRFSVWVLVNELGSHAFAVVYTTIECAVVFVAIFLTLLFHVKQAREWRR